MPWLGTVARLGLAVVLIWGSLSKLQSPRQFVQAARAYDVTADWASYAIGYGLPTLSMVLGVLLGLGVVVRLAAAATAAVFVLFLVAVVQAAIRGLDVRVGWFNVGGVTPGSTSYAGHILAALGLLVLSAYLIVWPSTRLSVDEYLARHDYVEEPSAKRMRTVEGRRKYEAAVAAKQKAARARNLYLNGSLALIVVLIAFISLGVQSNNAKVEGQVTSTNASPSHGVVAGTKAPATVEIYEDYQCVDCAKFERATAALLAADVKANRAQVRYIPVSLYDAASSGNRYSTRAANAAYCASDTSVEFFLKFRAVLFGKEKGTTVQPAVGGSGRRYVDFIRYAKAAGLPAKDTSFASCVRDESRYPLVEAATERASQRGMGVLPAVYVDGKRVAARVADLKVAIAAAVKAGPKPTPVPSSSAPSSPPVSSPPVSSPPVSSPVVSSPVVSSPVSSSSPKPSKK